MLNFWKLDDNKQNIIIIVFCFYISQLLSDDEIIMLHLSNDTKRTEQQNEWTTGDFEDYEGKILGNV